MAELEKVRRVIAEQLDGRPARDAARRSTRRPARTGCARPSCSPRAVDVDGIVLTKLDGSAKGGIAIAIARELGIPVKLIGVGEQLEDLRPFDADEFARALLDRLSERRRPPRDAPRGGAMLRPSRRLRAIIDAWAYGSVDDHRRCLRARRDAHEWFYLAPFAVGGAIAAVAGGRRRGGRRRGGRLRRRVDARSCCCCARSRAATALRAGAAHRGRGAGRPAALVLERIANARASARCKIGGEVWTARAFDEDAGDRAGRAGRGGGDQGRHGARHAIVEQEPRGRTDRRGRRRGRRLAVRRVADDPRSFRRRAPACSSGSAATTARSSRA